MLSFDGYVFVDSREKKRVGFWSKSWFSKIMCVQSGKKWDEVSSDYQYIRSELISGQGFSQDSKDLKGFVPKTSL